MTSAPAIGFEYSPSHWLQRLLWSVAVLALVAIVLCGLPVWLKLVMAALVVVLATHAVRSHRASPVTAAGWSDEGGWSLHFADRSDAPASLASFSVLGACILLRLRTASQGEQVLLLAPDNSDEDIRRRLRMRLAAVQPGEAVPRI
jgi:toxin CptA